jgi:hypothetical protein
MKVCVVGRRIYTGEAVVGTVTVRTEPNFGTPKCCIVIYMEANSNINAYDTTTADRNFGIGYAGPAGDGTSTINSFCQYQSMSNNVTTTAGRKQNQNTRFIVAHSATGTNYYQCTAVSFSADTASLTFTLTTPQTNINLDCIFIFFTGSDLTVGCGMVAMGTTNPSTVSVSTLNYAPDCVIAAFNSTVLNTGVNYTNGVEPRICFGAAVRLPTSTQKCIGYRVDFGTTRADYTYYDNNSIVGHLTSATIWGDYNLTTWGANGFTITSNNASANNNLMWMALKGQSGNDFMLVDLTTATANGNQYNAFGTTASRVQAIIGGIVGTPTANTVSNATPACESFNVFASQRSTSPLTIGAGTATSTTGTTAVTGSATTFRDLRQGDLIYTLDGTLIGTVSSVASNTSLTLAANGATAITNAQFTFSKPNQYCFTYGMFDSGTAASQVFSQVATTAIVVGKTTGTNQIVGSISDYDTRPGFNVNYTTSSTSVSLGWVLGFKDNDRSRRRLLD